VVKTVVRQVVPQQPMEVHSGADIYTSARGGPHAGAGGSALKEAAAHRDPIQEQAPGSSCCRMERSPCWSRFSGRTRRSVEDPCWSSLFLKDCTL